VASRAAAAADNFRSGEDRAVLQTDNYWLLMTGIMLASLLQILDTTIANVAIPHMQASLGATVDTISWVLTSYIIASAVALPITGWLADQVGGEDYFLCITPTCEIAVHRFGGRVHSHLDAMRHGAKP